MSDPTESIRRKRLVEINAEPGSRDALEAKYGQVWDTQQLAENFQVIGFWPRSWWSVANRDGVKGSLEFQHHPRLYWGFVEDK